MGDFKNIIHWYFEKQSDIQCESEIKQKEHRGVNFSIVFILQ